MSPTAAKFWESKTLAEMNETEWESLCDGCGRCCLIKLEEADTSEVAFIAVACRLLDTQKCRCRDYARRHQRVPDCIPLTPATVATTTWLPRTCAYRLVHEGKPLFPWHPLISGSPDSVHRAGISVRGRVLSESQVHPDSYAEHIIHWVG